MKQVNEEKQPKRRGNKTQKEAEENEKIRKQTSEKNTGKSRHESGNKWEKRGKEVSKDREENMREKL